MIPKKIHYCWFGRGKKPYLIRKCLKSWQRIMPDYEIKEWNEDNFDVNVIPFVKQAYEERKWAFVADVCRFYACYKEGGIYLDTDVEVFKRLDKFIEHRFFAGTEYRPREVGVDHVSVDASAFGCEKGHWYAQECFNWYSDKPFLCNDGSVSGGVVQNVASLILEKYGYEREDRQQIVRDVVIYPSTVFTNKYDDHDKVDTYTLHHFDGSWTDSDTRGWLFKFCRRHDLMHWYRLFERIIH